MDGGIQGLMAAGFYGGVFMLAVHLRPQRLTASYSCWSSVSSIFRRDEVTWQGWDLRAAGGLPDAPLLMWPLGWDGMGRDGTGWDGMGWDGMGGDGMGWDGVGWGGMGHVTGYGVTWHGMV